MDEYKYDRSFLHNFGYGGQTGFSPIISANVGLSFVSTYKKNRGEK
jgi:hypothetical protein